MVRVAEIVLNGTRGGRESLKLYWGFAVGVRGECLIGDMIMRILLVFGNLECRC